MKKVTAYTIFMTAEGIRISVVYSDISDDGIIIKDNMRMDRILVDSAATDEATKLMEYAQKYINKES